MIYRPGFHYGVEISFVAPTVYFKQSFYLRPWAHVNPQAHHKRLKSAGLQKEHIHGRGWFGFFSSNNVALMKAYSFDLLVDIN